MLAKPLLGQLREGLLAKDEEKMEVTAAIKRRKL
jgi:hypothetical protein